VISTRHLRETTLVYLGAKVFSPLYRRMKREKEKEHLLITFFADGHVLMYNLSPTADAKPNLIRSFEAHYAKDTHAASSSAAAAATATSPSVTILPSSTVTHARIKRDAPHLVTAGCDGSVAIWDLSRDAKVIRIEENTFLKYK
jgi:hypothetical protein